MEQVWKTLAFKMKSQHLTGAVSALHHLLPKHQLISSYGSPDPLCALAQGFSKGTGIPVGHQDPTRGPWGKIFYFS